MASPNMNLTIPVPSQTGGPQYANDEVNCFNAIDSHNHTSGQGVKVPINGLDINQNLNMNTLSVTNLKSIQFLNSAIAPGSSSLYMLGNNLYFRDGTDSFNVQITNGASVNVSGQYGFTGLPSGTASAAFLPLSATFRFQSATDVGATTDIGPLKLRNTTANSNAITITPPTPLPADYTLTMPSAKPSTDSFLVCSSTGALSFQSTSFVLPAGVMMMYGGVASPAGWLFCDGSVVSQATYANLFAAIGTAFNTGGEGAGNFRLPDFRRKAPVGAGGTGSATLGNAVGNSGGGETVTLTTANLPSAATTTSAGTHQHNLSISTSGNPGSAYNVAIGGNQSVTQTTVYPPFINPQTMIFSAGAHTHTISGATDTPANIIQPSLVVNYIIKY